MLSAIASTFFAAISAILTAATDGLAHTLYGCTTILWGFFAIRDWHNIHKRHNGGL